MKCQENDTLSPSRLGSDDPIDSTPGESETDETKPYLDTPDLSAAEDSEEKEPKPKRIKIQRSISLRKLAKLMSFEQWCLEVTIRRWKQRKFRRRQLSLLHREAIFELLNGSEFGLQLA
jgi:hypothetical protein